MHDRNLGIFAGRGGQAEFVWSCVNLPARSVVGANVSNEGQAMRDIRGDLQDRAALLEEQINAHEAQFDKLIDQLRREHDSRLEDLKTELEAVTRLMELELRRLETAPSAQRGQGREQPAPHAVHQPQHAAHHQAQPQHQPQAPLADFLVRKLTEVGAKSRDDLRRLSLQEG